MLMANSDLSIGSVNYPNSLVGFLNTFANLSIGFKSNQLDDLIKAWNMTMESLSNIQSHELSNNNNNNENSKLSIPVIESLFAVIGKSILNTKMKPPMIDSLFIHELKSKTKFLSFCGDKTTSRANMEGRLKVASEFYKEFYGKSNLE